LSVNGSVETYGDCGVCPRGQRTDENKICRECMGSPDHYDWLYLGFMALLPLVLHWFFIEWYSGKKRTLAQEPKEVVESFQLWSGVSGDIPTPPGCVPVSPTLGDPARCSFEVPSNPKPSVIQCRSCNFAQYTIVFIYYAFCLVLMMLLRPLLVKKIACGLGKSDRFRSIYAALYFFPILTVLQAVGGGLLYYAFPYIILVLSLVTLAVYMSASEVESFKDLLVRKKRLVVLFSHWLLHAYGIISISKLDKLEQDLPLLALVPAPALFYLMTAKYTEPSRILSEGGIGH
ncbi:JNK1/MAPK8-associated membrane protein, partial [Calypte anna]